MARILIADDDPGAREMLARICTHHGHEVLDARDAARARERYHSFGPELVIVDLAMPHGGGQQLIEWIREAEAARENLVAEDLAQSVLGDAGPVEDSARCKVIVVTGYAKALSTEEREALDADRILPKPVELQTMLRTLDELLGAPPA